MRQLREKELKRLKEMKERNGGRLLRTAIYARKSNVDRTDTSIATQLKICREFIHKYGSLLSLEESLIFTEDDVTGYDKTKRKEFNLLNDELDKGNIDVIVTYKIDRISRNLSHREPILSKIADSGAYIIAGDDLGDDSATGILLSQLQWALNEFHIRNIAENVMNVHTKIVKDGKTVGGPGNYGYIVKDRNYHKHPVESLAVELVFDLFLSGHSYSQISQVLEKKGYKPRKSAIFSNATINGILRNRRNCGESVWNAESKRKKGDRILKQQYPEVMSKDVVLDPIIDKDTFERVQVLLDSKSSGVIDKTGKVFMLSGLIECECGGSMSGTSTKKKSRTKPHYSYCCRLHSKRYGNKCGTKNINAEYLEKYVQKSIVNILNNHINVNGVDTELVNQYLSDEKHRIARLKREITISEEKMDKLIEGYHTEDDEFIRSRTKKSIKDLEQRIELVKVRIKELRKTLRNTNTRISLIQQGKLKVSDVFTNEIVNRRITRLFISSVIVSNDEVSIMFKEE